MSADGSGESMLTLQKPSIKKCCSADTRAESDHDCIPCSARCSESVLAEQRETGVIFQQERKSERVLKPCIKVEASCIIKLIVGGQHAFFAKANDAAKTEDHAGTTGAVHLGNLH